MVRIKRKEEEKKHLYSHYFLHPGHEISANASSRKPKRLQSDRGSEFVCLETFIYIVFYMYSAWA